jgi:hypothetical protein
MRLIFAGCLFLPYPVTANIFVQLFVFEYKTRDKLEKL